MSETHLSQAAYDRLQTELDDLTTTGRTKIAIAIERARELGDLSENGDYHAAKDEQGKMEARIRQVQAILDNAVIVEAAGGDKVEHGSVVTIRYEGDDDTEKYLIGSIEERQGDLAVISPGSPMGQALMGHGSGDTVQYEAPGGMLRVEIVAVGG
jgi:transcription elongation factor GreA